MVFDKGDERRRLEIEGVSAARLFLPCVELPLIEESPLCRGDKFLRSSRVVRIICLAMPGQRDVRSVMEVIVPDGIQAVAALSASADEAGVLLFVFGDQEDGPLSGGASCFARDVAKDVVGRIVEHLLGGIEPQAVQMELLDPVAGVGDEKLANGLGAGPVEVDGLAPLVFVTSGQVVVRKLF